jgi:hypothetical protein
MRRVLMPCLAAALLLPTAWAEQAEAPKGFEPLFNGRTLEGWAVHGGKMEAWGVDNGLIFTTGSGGGWLLTDKEYDNFEVVLEYRVPQGGNSGVALRTPRMGDPAYTGMEIQILDDDAPQYKNLRPAQYCGSIYDVVAARRGHNRPAGEWNRMHIVCNGRLVKVMLNGTVIVDADLDDQKEHYKKHPGLERKTGHLGLQSHSERVEFRNLYVKRL